MFLSCSSPNYNCYLLGKPFNFNTIFLVFSSILTSLLFLQWIIYPESVVYHVIIGAISGLAVLATIFYDEPELTRLVVNIVKKRLGKAD